MRPNRALWVLFGGVLALLAVTIFWQPASTLFHFGRLHWDDLAVCVVAGFFSLLVLEALKSRWFRVEDNKRRI